MSTEAQIAWAAGLFDGEGCVKIQLRKPRGGSVSPHHHLVVDLSNTHEQTVLRFSEIVGGGPISKTISKHPGRKDAWNFRVSSKKALRVLEVLLPYLVTKKEQAEIAIFFTRIETKRGHGRVVLGEETIRQRQNCMEQLAALK